MLREETKTFLDVYWKQYPNPNERKLQEKYHAQNPSGRANRIVKQINNGISEIAYALEKFPENYREKIDIEIAENLFRNRILDSTDKKAKLRLGKELLEEGIDILKKEIIEDDLLKVIYGPKFEEIKKLVQLLVQSKTKLPKLPKKGLRKSWAERDLPEELGLKRKH